MMMRSGQWVRFNQESWSLLVWSLRKRAFQRAVLHSLAFRHYLTMYRFVMYPHVCLAMTAHHRSIFQPDLFAARLVAAKVSHYRADRVSGWLATCLLASMFVRRGVLFLICLLSVCVVKRSVEPIALSKTFYRTSISTNGMLSAGGFLLSRKSWLTK